MTQFQSSVKRCFDLCLAFVAVVILCIPFLLLCLCCRLASGSPVFFRQRRIGREGRAFTCYKFRTMERGAETKGTVTIAADRRVTTMGRFLRRWKLDELPQLLNVFNGSMSFVGPRPDVPGYADRLRGEARELLRLRPGITGPATLFFRYEEEILGGTDDPAGFSDEVLWPLKVRMNLAYMRNWSLARDLGYILTTAFPFVNNWLKMIPSPPRSTAELGPT